jgi:hypothetical protein
MDRLTSLSGGFFLACQNPQTTSIQPGILARLHQQHYQAAYEFAGIDNIVFDNQKQITYSALLNIC